MTQDRPTACRLSFPFHFHRTVEQVDRDRERARELYQLRKEHRA